MPVRETLAQAVTVAIAFAVVPLLACTTAPAADEDANVPNPITAVDSHSRARPAEVSVRHLALDLAVDFDRHVLDGRVTLHLDRHSGDRLVLDTWKLDIRGVELEDGVEARYRLVDDDDLLGSALEIDLEPSTRLVHVDYSTSPEARALQWLAPRQTAGGRRPFLFTQSQAILARSWIPLQDSPAVRFTWEATVRVPGDLLAVMSAANPTVASPDGVYRFEMPQPVPSYLMALAVGDLAFRAMGERSGVYAEPAIVEGAAWELADTEAMIAAAESLYGPYRWERYDVLVLPPSFPFGGMENPRLTFATPTILAGDRSLVALVAHELAHSWSGNLVTNATWDDFWLNEGFTVYFEQRIMEALYGRDYAEMLALLSLQGLEREIAEIGPESVDTHLRLALHGRDPDDGMTAIAYDKGHFFLRMLEEAVGRDRWDAFLARYFEENAFRSQDTDGFLADLDRDLLSQLDEATVSSLQIGAWVDGPGLPSNAPQVHSDAFAQVEEEIARWASGTPADDLRRHDWETQRLLHFIHNLPTDLDEGRMAELDRVFGFSESGNSEILAAWLEVAIRSDYAAADPALVSFLTRQGRRKFLVPLYKQLLLTEAGRAKARRIYAAARPGYHPVATGTLDALVLGDGE